MYQIEWIVEKRIVLIRGMGDQTHESIAESVVRIHELFNEGDAPVHAISDNRYLGKLPTDLSTLKKLMAKHDKSGSTVMVGGDTITKFFSKMLTQFSGLKQPQFTDSIEDAIQWLQVVDQSLPDEINLSELS